MKELSIKEGNIRVRVENGCIEVPCTREERGLGKMAWLLLLLLFRRGAVQCAKVLHKFICSMKIGAPDAEF